MLTETFALHAFVLSNSHAETPSTTGSTGEISSSVIIIVDATTESNNAFFIVIFPNIYFEIEEDFNQ